MHGVWKIIWKRTVEKSQTNATNVTMLALIQVHWGHIWKCTVEKGQINATNVTMPLLGQVIWGHIWKRTVGKSKTNATNVILPLLRQVIWGNIWKRTVGKSQINATNVTLPLLGKTILEDTWKHTAEKYDFASSYARSSKAHFKTHSEKIKKMQPMWSSGLTFWGDIWKKTIQLMQRFFNGNIFLIFFFVQLTPLPLMAPMLLTSNAPCGYPL